MPHSTHLLHRMSTAIIDLTARIGAGSFQSFTLTCNAGRQVVVDGEPDSVATHSQHIESGHAGRPADGLEDHMAGPPPAEI